MYSEDQTVNSTGCRPCNQGGSDATFMSDASALVYALERHETLKEKSGMHWSDGVGPLSVLIQGLWHPIKSQENAEKLLYALREDIDRDREGFDPRSFRPGNPLCLGNTTKHGFLRSTLRKAPGATIRLPLSDTLSLSSGPIKTSANFVRPISSVSRNPFPCQKRVGSTSWAHSRPWCDGPIQTKR